MNLKQYRINTNIEMDAYIASAGEDFIEYYQAMQVLIAKLQFYERFDILKNIPQALHERFVKAACVCIQHEKRFIISFSEDYLYLIKKP